MAKTATFLDLPFEIRLRIYVAMTEWPSVMLPRFAEHFQQKDILPMLKTCRGVHDELITYIFSSKLVHASGRHITRSLIRLNSTALGAIRFLTFPIESDLIELAWFWHTFKEQCSSLSLLKLTYCLYRPDPPTWLLDPVLDMILVLGEQKLEKVRLRVEIEGVVLDWRSAKRKEDSLGNTWTNALARQGRYKFKLATSITNITFALSVDFETRNYGFDEFLLLRVNRMWRFVEVERSPILDSISKVVLEWRKVEDIEEVIRVIDPRVVGLRSSLVGGVAQGHSVGLESDAKGL